MPPLRRSIDLAETCAFLAEVAADARVGPEPVVAASSVDPGELRTDVVGDAAVAIRNFFACPVCEAVATQRCRADGSTSAYLHEGRIRTALA